MKGTVEMSQAVWGADGMARAGFLPICLGDVPRLAPHCLLVDGTRRGLS